MSAIQEERSKSKIPNTHKKQTNKNPCITLHLYNPNTEEVE